MSERQDVVNSIVNTIEDYQGSDFLTPSPEHVEQWITQFDIGVHLPILREMDHVLKRTYFSQAKTQKFLGGLVRSEKLAGSDPCAYWQGVSFLDIQEHGASQREMTKLFQNCLATECAPPSHRDDNEPHAYIYLDDAIFTGNRLLRDLTKWINGPAPQKARVEIIAIALHRNGYAYARDKIKNAITGAKKDIQLGWWRAAELEDRRSHKDQSDVLWPTEIPDDHNVSAYVQAMKYPPVLRAPGQTGENTLFSSDSGRQLLESEFLKAGARIRQICPNLNKYQRPLGNSVLETLGSGTMMVTFRNCPNNAPLALWAGEPWYPLFPRRTNSSTAIAHAFSSITEGI